MTSQKLPHYPLDDTQRQAIVSCWLKQLSRSPHFASTTPQFHETSHQFLSNVLHATANKSYPSVDTEALSESFSIWHTILSDLRKKGFTTRDSALLIFQDSFLNLLLLKIDCSIIIKVWIENWFFRCFNYVCVSFPHMMYSWSVLILIHFIFHE